MEIKDVKQLLFQAEEQIASLGEHVSKEIFCHPELGDQEFFSSKFLTDEMKKLGFSVTMPYCGIETAFRCEYGDEEGPKVAFIAEYDALPGYGPNHDENGHACGHNWIAASTLQAAAALQKVKQYFKGKIVFIGTPAEETVGRKIDMQRAGGFDDIDAAFQMHLGEKNSVETVALACTDVTFHFHGKAAHASHSPELGVNALDACNLTFAGVNALRQHVTSDVRIHGVIQNGGSVCNVVPDYSRMQYFVRAAKKDYLEEVVEKVVNCARGAELMTGARLEWERCPNTFYDYLRPNLLQKHLRANMEEQGIEYFESDSIYHSGSTDIGNVSYSCPTSYATLSTLCISPAFVHDEAFLQVADSDFAHKLLHISARSMAATALEILMDDKFRSQVKAEFEKEKNSN